MRYLLMICGDETMEVSPEEASADAWVEEMDGRGVRLEGNRLALTTDATTVRVREGDVLVSDGPFAETKEQIGGYDVIECADLDEAIEVRPFWQ